MKDKFSTMKTFVLNHRTSISAISGVAIGTVIGIKYASNYDANQHISITATKDALWNLAVQESWHSIEFRTKAGIINLKAVDKL